MRLQKGGAAPSSDPPPTGVQQGAGQWGRQAGQAANTSHPSIPPTALVGRPHLWITIPHCQQQTKNLQSFPKTPVLGDINEKQEGNGVFPPDSRKRKRQKMLRKRGQERRGTEDAADLVDRLLASRSQLSCACHSGCGPTGSSSWRASPPGPPNSLGPRPWPRFPSLCTSRMVIIWVTPCCSLMKMNGKRLKRKRSMCPAPRRVNGGGLPVGHMAHRTERRERGDGLQPRNLQGDPSPPLRSQASFLRSCKAALGMFPGAEVGPEGSPSSIFHDC